MINISSLTYIDYDEWYDEDSDEDFQLPFKIQELYFKLCVCFKYHERILFCSLKTFFILRYYIPRYFSIVMFSIDFPSSFCYNPYSMHTCK